MSHQCLATPQSFRLWRRYITGVVLMFGLHPHIVNAEPSPPIRRNPDYIFEVIHSAHRKDPIVLCIAGDADIARRILADRIEPPPILDRVKASREWILAWVAEFDTNTISSASYALRDEHIWVPSTMRETYYLFTRETFRLFLRDQIEINWKNWRNIEVLDLVEPNTEELGVR